MPVRGLARYRLAREGHRFACIALVIGVAGLVVAQEARVPPDATIRLQRTSCFGSCPVYTVTIDARGGVTYEGERFVRVVGRRTARIDTAAVAGLLATAERSGFFQMRDAYRLIDHPDGSRTSVSDLPTTIVAITANGRAKTVEDYLDAPDALAELERAIDAAAGSRRWVFIDEDALRALTRSGWSAASEEGATLLQQAIERDDVAIARRLIELGSTLHGPAGHRLTPLLTARSAAMVDLLVRSGADPNERPSGSIAARTALMAAATRDASVAESLLRAGARIEDTDDGRTALWYAACAGNWRTVAVLLAAGADPAGSREMPAAACARQAQGSLSPTHRALDRGRPTSRDFDQVIALLNDAQRRVKR
jgi:Domain of unknown function (DUF6438)/Ankyrin repeats (3 copies)